MGIRLPRVVAAAHQPLTGRRDLACRVRGLFRSEDSTMGVRSLFHIAWKTGLSWWGSPAEWCPPCIRGAGLTLQVRTDCGSMAVAVARLSHISCGSRSVALGLG